MLEQSRWWHRDGNCSFDTHLSSGKWPVSYYWDRLAQMGSFITQGFRCILADPLRSHGCGKSLKKTRVKIVMLYSPQRIHSHAWVDSRSGDFWSGLKKHSARLPIMHDWTIRLFRSPMLSLSFLLIKRWVNNAPHGSSNISDHRRYLNLGRRPA